MKFTQVILLFDLMCKFSLNEFPPGHTWYGSQPNPQLTRKHEEEHIKARIKAEWRKDE
jgi:hypothetical protein